MEFTLHPLPSSPPRGIQVLLWICTAQLAQLALFLALALVGILDEGWLSGLGMQGASLINMTGCVALAALPTAAVGTAWVQRRQQPALGWWAAASVGLALLTVLPYVVGGMALALSNGASL